MTHEKLIDGLLKRAAELAEELANTAELEGSRIDLELEEDIKSLDIISIVDRIERAAQCSAKFNTLASAIQGLRNSL